MNTQTKDRLWRIARASLAWLAIYALMVGLGAVLPVPASDWYHHFLPRKVDYPPLVLVLLALLPSVPFLSGLTLTALLAALWKRHARPVHILAAFTTMPLFWTLWLGQLDAVPMLGLAFLPWGIPLVLVKPHVAVWYVWAWWRQQPHKWKIVLGVAAFVALTFVIWGWWVPRTSALANTTTVYNVSLWKVWPPLGIVAMLAALLERDPDRAMALGALGVPYLQGVSYLVLVPALARLSGWLLLLVWLASWAALAALAWGDAARPLAALFPLTLWAVLAWQEYRHSHTMSPSGT